MCLIPFQSLFVGVELYLASRLTEKAISGRVLFERYISAPIALRYGTSGPKISSLCAGGRNGSLLTSSDRTTIGVLNGLPSFLTPLKGETSLCVLLALHLRHSSNINRMRSDRRILAMIAVQQITIDIVVGLFILLYIIHMLMSRNNRPRRVRTRRYTVNSRISYQIKNLHRLVSLSDSSCLRNLRMDRNAFGRLCYILEHSGGLTTTKHVTMSEQVAMFLSIIAHHKKNCVVKHDFLRSGRTVSKHFHAVLNTIYKLTHVFLAKAIPIADDCADPWWRCFKTKEGTVLGKDKLRLMFSEFAIPTCNSYMCSLVGKEAPQETTICVTTVMQCRWLLDPIPCVCYHLQEWDRGHGGPQNPRELFNLKHSSARNVIERAFRLLKVRWGILRSQSFYLVDTQNKIIFVCCLLHNFLRNEMSDDPFELEILDEDNACSEANAECIGSIDTTTAWTSWRDQLAPSMYTEWLSRP
ncbi:UNVERIFIED_CONTAM: hypothetical protein Sradi_1512500 [Sesamum radiatum]|uniref:DDE Tnp4 domain-containing protein n=1 Tax=Sesamum radiatum TaxID=300843 RepID=A0AAW2U8C1_SESRA